MRFRGLILGVSAIGAMIAGTTSATAAPLDCRTGCNFASYGNGVLWSTVSVQPSGTGVIDPFVRLQTSGSGNNEQGMNTDVVTSLDEKAGIWTHDLKFADVPIVTYQTRQYYEFLLDIAEPDADNKSEISLDGLKICISDVGDQYNPAGGGCTTASATQVYSLDTNKDRVVLLDYDFIGGGNGNSDLFVYIPVSTLGLASATNQYLYLWSQFGLVDYSEGSFEEWAVRKSGGGTGIQEVPGVPEPSTVVLLGTGLALALGHRRLRSRRER